MKRSEVFRAEGRILTGRYPSLSIEITRGCPLRCPGCYAYEPEHLGNEVGPLRSFADESRSGLRRAAQAVRRAKAYSK
jgi:pyruvate-formate lyase-activating enzyme